MKTSSTMQQVGKGGRRWILRAVVAALGAAALTIGGVTPALAAPVTLNIVDVAGNLALTQDAIDAYVKKHPEAISKVTYTKTPRRNCRESSRRCREPGAATSTSCSTGTDFLAAGIDQGVLMKILPDQAAKFPNLTANYQPAAAKMQELAEDYGVAVVFMPAGPLVEYNPAKVKQLPTTPAELLAWCKANPNRLIYARPANSGPGAHVHHGPALHPRRQESEGPGERMGKDLGVSQGTQQLHRVLPDRHRCRHEGTGRGLARHDGHDDGLGHQSARAGHRAQGIQGHAIQGDDLGQRRALHDDSEGRRRRKKWPPWWT